METGLGGALFLVNVMRHLELLDRIEDQFAIASSIGGWGWVEVLARALLGAGRPELAVDPLWRVLAELDGRGVGVAIDQDFLGRPPYVLPTSWDRVPSDPPSRAVTGATGSPFGLSLSPSLGAFVEFLLPYLQRRLARALEMDEDWTADGVATALLLRRGRVFVTSSHIDVQMSLEEVRVDVRLAGLDANPGWVPALGRVVTFHYE